jgi:hypothetical protein
MLPGVQSYFLTRKQEAMLEAQGVQSLYSNLARSGQLTGTGNVVFCFGVGRHTRGILGSGQDASNYEVITAAGMDDLKQLSSAVPEMVKEWISQDANIDRLVQLVETTSQPVLALKAGSTILLNNSFVREALLSPASFIYDYCRGTYTLTQSRNATPVVKEIALALEAIQRFVGPIVRIKDQTAKGFLLVNVLFWSAIEEKPLLVASQTSPANKSATKQATSDLTKTDAKDSTSEKRRKLSSSAASVPNTAKDGAPTDVPKPKNTTSSAAFTNLALLCEVQIRVHGAVDDHLLYELRRNFVASKPVEEGCFDFFRDAAGHEFRRATLGASATIYQGPAGEILQSVR